MMYLTYSLGFVILSTSLYWTFHASRIRKMTKPACYLYFCSQYDESELTADKVGQINRQVKDGWKDMVEREVMIQKARSYAHWKPQDIYRMAKMSGYES